MNPNYFTTRKTIRKYKDGSIIPEDILNSMLEQAAQAPTTGGMQLYSVIVTTDKGIKAKLAPCHFNQPQVMTASAVLTFCADFNRFVKWCESGNAKHGYDNFQSFVTALLDTAIFAQQFNTIAELNGYGCCYLGTATYNAPQIAEILNLPNRVVPVATITIGIPDNDTSEKAERLPLEGILHNEIYSDYSIDDIHRIFSGKESLPVNKKYTEENGKSHLAQVFTDIRYTKANNEHFSKVYYDFIETSKFRFPG